MRKIKVTLQSSSRDQKQPAVAGGDTLSAPGTPVLRTLGLTPCTPTRETPQRPPRLAGAGCQAAGQRLAGGGGFQVGLGALGPPVAQESSCPSRSQHCPHLPWGEPVCPQDATHGGWPVAQGISIHSESTAPGAGRWASALPTPTLRLWSELGPHCHPCFPPHVPCHPSTLKAGASSPRPASGPAFWRVGG